MSTAIPTAHELREQAITAVRQGQETTLTLIRSVVEAVSAASAKLPATPLGRTVPLADKLPSPEAVVARAYDLAGQVLSAQRKLVEQAAKLPAPEGLRVQLADKLPSREAVVAGAYDFAGQLLAEQRKFTEEILKITAVLRPSAAGDGRSPAADMVEEAGPAEPAT
ncbi:MAG TPA: hypothetical protein VHZ03_35845 [Trebonia sp.]|jgi:hypothetical protein|nr:hypothetical protein [Trebonia sp.]